MMMLVFNFQDNFNGYLSIEIKANSKPKLISNTSSIDEFAAGVRSPDFHFMDDVQPSHEEKIHEWDVSMAVSITTIGAFAEKTHFLY